jgi:hypothetical protein
MGDIEKEEVTGLLSLEIEDEDENDSSSEADERIISRAYPLHPPATATTSRRYMQLGIAAAILLTGWLVINGKSSGDEHYYSIKPTSSSDDSQNNIKCVNARGKPCYANSHVYERRGRPLTMEEEERISKEWGSWEFQIRRTDMEWADDIHKFSHRDVPDDGWPLSKNSNPWQRDPVYLKAFLTDALALVDRTQSAIRTEYGDKHTDMFDVAVLETWPDDEELHKLEESKGGWTMQKSWKNLKRRLAHAIVTQNSFVFAMSGHSAR